LIIINFLIYRVFHTDTKFKKSTILKFKKMKRVLITGAAGFLGSHLCDRFIKEGYMVV